MANRIELLLQVQELDLARDELVRERDSGPVRLAEARAPLAAIQAAEKAARERAQECVRAREKLEKDIEFERSKLEERDRKLRGVKTNEEFQAGQRELTEQRKRITAMEDEVLGQMERLETLQSEIKKAGDDAVGATAGFAKLEREINASLEGIEDRIGELEGRIAEARTHLERAMLGHYDFLRGRRGGSAVSEIKGGICQACRTRIPHQMYNELHAPDSHHICPSCSRIVFVRALPRNEAVEAQG